MRRPLGGVRGGDPRVHLTLVRRLVVAAALFAVVALALGLYGDLGRVGHELASFHWWLFPVALALTTLNYAIRFWRWQLYLSRLDIDVPLLRSATIFGSGLTMAVSPGKLGEVLKSALLRRSFGVPVARSAPIVVVERISDALGVIALAAVAGGVAVGLPLLAVGAAGAVALVLLLRSRLLDRFERLRDARSSAADLLGMRLLVVTTAITAVAWLCECVGVWLCVRGLGPRISFADAVVVFSIGSLAGGISFLPGGLGVAEGSMAALLQTLAGLAAAPAAAATVLIRLATLWFAVALGLAALAAEERLAARRVV